MTVDPIPEGYHTVTPYLPVPDTLETLAFVQCAFAAEEVQRSNMPDGTVMNIEVRIGDLMVIIGQAREQ